MKVLEALITKYAAMKLDSWMADSRGENLFDERARALMAEILQRVDTMVQDAGDRVEEYDDGPGRGHHARAMAAVWRQNKAANLGGAETWREVAANERREAFPNEHPDGPSMAEVLMNILEARDSSKAGQLAGEYIKNAKYMYAGALADDV